LLGTGLHLSDNLSYGGKGEHGIHLNAQLNARLSPKTSPPPFARKARSG
jgi:hypothetical protein